jgi:hypothetical protein
MKKKSSSQASWSILSQGVSSARVEAHIVRTHMNQMVEAIKENPQLAEEIYKRCGDNFEALPRHLSKLERSLDRTNYALISMGSDWYRQRLTHEDREMVDMASKYNPTPFPSTSKQSSNRQARTNFEVAEWLENRLYDDFGFSSLKVLSVKEDREDKNSLYALVHCEINNKWATIYQDDEGDQQLEKILLDERRTRSDFDRQTTGSELTRRASAKRIAKMRFEDFILDHIDGLSRIDPEYDDGASDKFEALFGGDFEEAIRLARNPRAKAYIEFMRDKYIVWSEDLF